MLNLSLRLGSSRGTTEHQGPRCVRTEAGFGFGLGNRRNVKQHLAVVASALAGQTQRA